MYDIPLIQSINNYIFAREVSEAGEFGINVGIRNHPTFFVLFLGISYEANWIKVIIFSSLESNWREGKSRKIQMGLL